LKLPILFIKKPLVKPFSTTLPFNFKTLTSKILTSYYRVNASYALAILSFT
jgi:hypothetical protein